MHLIKLLRFRFSHINRWLKHVYSYKKTDTQNLKGENGTFTWNNDSWDNEVLCSTETENIEVLENRLFPNKARFLCTCLVWFFTAVVDVTLKIAIHNKLNLNLRLFGFNIL